MCNGKVTARMIIKESTRRKSHFGKNEFMMSAGRFRIFLSLAIVGRSVTVIYCGAEWRTLPGVWGSTLSTKGSMFAVQNFGLGSNPND